MKKRKKRSRRNVCCWWNSKTSHLFRVESTPLTTATNIKSSLEPNNVIMKNWSLFAKKIFKFSHKISSTTLKRATPNTYKIKFRQRTAILRINFSRIQMGGVLQLSHWGGLWSQSGHERTAALQNGRIGLRNGSTLPFHVPENTVHITGDSTSRWGFPYSLSQETQ